MEMKTELIIRKLVFADIGVSDEIQTDLPIEIILDTFKEFGINQIAYDEENKKVKLRKNFDVKINTSDFEDNKSFTLEFNRYYHRFYAFYVIAAFILSILLAVVYHFPTGSSRKISINFILFLLPIALIWIVFETIRAIKGIKGVDYSKEADNIFLEIFNAIKEKEQEGM